MLIPLGAALGVYRLLCRARDARTRREAQLGLVEHLVEPRGGRMIAVNVDRAGTESARSISSSATPRDVRRAEGKWSNGSWRDFDPRAPLAAV